MKIRLTLDRRDYDRKPDSIGPKEVAFIRSRMGNIKPVDITPEQLMTAIQRGRTFYPCEITGTGGKDWQSQQAIACDVDNAIEIEKGKKVRIDNPLQPDEALEILREVGINPYFMYYSFSNAPDWPRYRVVLILSEKITNKNEAVDLTKRVINVLEKKRVGAMDTDAHDNARLFFGGKADCVFYNSEQVTSLETLRSLPKLAEDPAPKKPKRKNKVENSDNSAALPPRSGLTRYDDLMDQLAVDKNSFDLLDYILSENPECETHGGGPHSDTMVSPCPICQSITGLKVNGAVWHCHSTRHKTYMPDKGSVIDWLMSRNNWTQSQALDYFKFDIMHYDREKWRQAWREKQQVTPAQDFAPEDPRVVALARYAGSLRAQSIPAERLAEMVVTENRQGNPPLDDEEVNAILSLVMTFAPGTSLVNQGFARGPARIDRAAAVGEMVNAGYDVRMNVITGDYDISGTTPAGRRASLDDIVTMLYDLLAKRYKGVSLDLLQRYITFRGRENSYNPVLDLLSATTWDEIDRVPQVYALLGLSDDDTLSRTLVYKWLLQTVALLYNDDSDGREPFGADGCLTFVGAQGAGKTSFFAHLAMRNSWFEGGAVIKDYDKDTTRRIVTKWIAELGEVESTLKSDINALKAFVTQHYDRYRLPYGRGDTNSPRHVSLCATCNSGKYLIDPTGNRRWWTVPVNRTIPRQELLDLDPLQLWAQIYAKVDPLSYQEKGNCFRLSEDEQAALLERNASFEKSLKGQDEVADILAQAERDGIIYRRMTVHEFKSQWPGLRQYSVQQIGAALKKCGIETDRKNGERLKLLPPGPGYY